VDPLDSFNALDRFLNTNNDPFLDFLGRRAGIGRDDVHLVQLGIGEHLHPDEGKRQQTADNQDECNEVGGDAIGGEPANHCLVL